MNRQRRPILRASAPFLKLVRAYERSSSPSDTAEALAFWCRGMPEWYQAGLWRGLRLQRPARRFPSGEAGRVSRHEARAVRELTRRLNAARALPVFLMKDASPLEAHHRRAGGVSLALRFGRPDLPSPRRASYLQMFELVNRAAVAAGGNRMRFLRHYDAGVRRFGQTETGRKVDRVLARRAGPVLSAVAAAAARGQAVVIVDTGMQGTFALFVARWLEARLALTPHSVGVRLIAAYPWLRTLFRDWHVTTDCRVVARLERALPSTRRRG